MLLIKTDRSPVSSRDYEFTTSFSSEELTLWKLVPNYYCCKFATNLTWEWGTGTWETAFSGDRLADRLPREEKAHETSRKKQDDLVVKKKRL